ncbi:MAG: hypothetical protein DDT40_00586 [candidate division WS2 bacterium]|uniref:Uncharacterized protein n=1 Tax=Psychracetigena formicireducens TaxID=2986056 RepID=A0A9E2BHB2_PSYF1|nr:hypothetical protein [Candidatus Psychracetigena formicireducens]MBT9145054.1 hypothetical protein [Candidatus Psychracetigena formicireducens]MBT9150414.1 hypothetical protein [Candidatus Psychracetigena formicireducens]
MSEPEMKPAIKDKILEAIKNKQVKIKPRWHFMVKSLLVATALIFAFMTLIFFISFVVFYLRLSGAWFLPVFGFRGWRILLTSLPWLVIGFSILLLVIVEALAKNYAPVYRKPILLSVAAIMVIALVSSFALYATPMHQRLFIYSRDQQFPLTGPLYRQYGMMRHSEFTPGIITLFINDNFRILTPLKESFLVITNADTAYPRGRELLVGDTVVIIGRKENGTIFALGVRKIREGEKFWYHHMPGPRY